MLKSDEPTVAAELKKLGSDEVRSRLSRGEYGDINSELQLFVERWLSSDDAIKKSASETAANTYGRRSLWVQGTIAFATSIYVLIAIFQLGAMKSTLEQTRKSAEAAKIAADAAADSAKTTRLALELSAVPEVQPEEVTCSTPVGADSRVTLHFRNTGGRRAANVSIDWAIDVPGVSSVPSPKNQSLMLIGAGQGKKSTTTQTLGDIVGDVRLSLIREGKLELGLSGRIDYKDVFGKAHWTTFSYRYRPNTDCTFDIMTVSAE